MTIMMRKMNLQKRLNLKQSNSKSNLENKVSIQMKTMRMKKMRVLSLSPKILKAKEGNLKVKRIKDRLKLGKRNKRVIEREASNLISLLRFKKKTRNILNIYLNTVYL